MLTRNSPEVISITPGGGRVKDARLLLLKLEFFDPEVCKYLIGKRSGLGPPSYKAFLEWAQKRGEIDADE